jgi:hypothetical protein
MTDVALQDIYSTIQMSQRDKFDIRTITLGINLIPCISDDFDRFSKNVKEKIILYSSNLNEEAKKAEAEFGVPITNKRLILTPASLLLGGFFGSSEKINQEICLKYAKVLDDVCEKQGIDFVGGYGALTDMGETQTDKTIISSLPYVLVNSNRVCAFVNIGSTKYGINMSTVKKMGEQIVKLSTDSEKSFACAKLVVFCNAVADNPFMAGGFYGVQNADASIHVGLSGPGVVRNVIQSLPKDLPLDDLVNEIKKETFKIVRAGELIGNKVAERMNIPFGSVDLSLAPTTQIGDSVGEILELFGLERVGTHGSTAALAMLTDAVKKGGVAASANVGGLSGAFIPVSEDQFLSDGVKFGSLTLDKLEAMTSVCSVGLDMVAIPGDTSAETISAIISDEMAIGMVNHKTTAVRIIPVKGHKAGDYVNWGGLFGGAYILPVHKEKSTQFINRGGRIPPSITSFRN